MIGGDKAVKGDPDMATSTIDAHETVQQSDGKRSHTMALPPLENGDRLTREEFEKRYAAMPDVKKAELIDGVVYMGSPVRFGKHSEPHAALLTWLGTYARFYSGRPAWGQRNRPPGFGYGTTAGCPATHRAGGLRQFADQRRRLYRRRARVGRRNLCQYGIVRSARQNGMPTVVRV